MGQSIAVVGFGKIGQAVGAAIVDRGIPLIGIDLDPRLATAFEEGRFVTSEPQVGEVLLGAAARGDLCITSDFAAVADAAAVIVCIPLLIDAEKRILTEPFLECFESIAVHLRDRCVLSVETSIPVGFSRQTILPVLEKHGKLHGVDFLLVHSPERIKSGSMLEQLHRTPKVVGGLDEDAVRRGTELYCGFIDASLVRPVSSIEVAELIKLAGMVYRDINIALANELAAFATSQEIDFDEVLDCTNTDGEAFLLRPGIGVGGHCTPVYPHFLIENFRDAGQRFELAEAGRRLNEQVPEKVVARVCDEGGISSAGLLGLGFRPDVKEDAFSVSFPLREALERRGVKVWLHDPLYSAEELHARGFEAAETPYRGADAVFLVTHHSSYRDLDFERLAASGCHTFVDGRNAVAGESVKAAGLRYVGMGRQG